MEIVSAFENNPQLKKDAETCICHNHSMGLYLEQYDYLSAHELWINNFNGYFFVSQCFITKTCLCSIESGIRGYILHGHVILMLIQNTK